MMSETDLTFHIARKSGLEFVFSRGGALSYPLHTHVSVYTITLVRKGAVSVERPSGTSAYQPGDIYVDGPHEPHSPAYEAGYDIVSLCVDKRHFIAMGCPALLELCDGYTRGLVAESLLSPEDVRSIFAGIEKIYARLAVAPPVITELVGGVQESGGWQRPNRHHDRNDRHDRHDRLDFNLSTGNRFNYLRRFKKQKGLTPHQHLVQSQVKQAKKLLSSHSIAEAALEAGFYDQSHLNRWFNKTIGLTPRRYIRACRFLD